MSRLVTKVDHAILFVRDLDAAAAKYRRLGFTLTPRYTHPWGGFSNFNLMFQDDYVELLLPVVAAVDRHPARVRSHEPGEAGAGRRRASPHRPERAPLARRQSACRPESDEAIRRPVRTPTRSGPETPATSRLADRARAA